MSWHRTVFSSLVLALLTTRAGLLQGDILLASMGSLSGLISLILVPISLHRQRAVIQDTDLLSRSAVLHKQLICIAMGLNALAIALHGLVNSF